MSSPAYSYPPSTRATQLPEDNSELGGMGEIPAWAVSCLLHLAVLFLLWQFTLEGKNEVDPSIISAMDDEELLPEDFKFDATIVDQMGSDSVLNTLSPSQAAATQAGENPQKVLEQKIDEELLTVKQPVTDEMPVPNESEFVAAIDLTGATEHTGGVEGSMDRLTYEIAGSLRERKTLVVWMFDASLSLKERRNAIADRFENVYKQLGQLNVGAERALKTAVVSFGKGVNFLTPDPVDDITEVIPVVRKIDTDGTPSENVFSAVYKTAQKWGMYRTQLHRNVMFVIVTDERGDDYEGLETTVQYVRRMGIRVYCVGHAAPFGREKGYVLWTYEDGGTENLPVDAGPESVAMERLRLGFWGGNGRQLDEMSAGFGPYALTRLCAESGGLYLITSESVRGPRFDPAIMRNYAPDYGPIRDYQLELQKNKAKGALVAAATASQAENVVAPQLTFRADNDNVLRQEITEAQKPAAIFGYKLQQMLTILEQGEKDREKLNSPRWRAAYDLAIGRVLAMQARTYGYNVVLADMKSTPKTFEKKGSNHWRLVPSREIAGGPTVKKLATRAKEYLQRVVDEHSGTPWEMLAARELSQEMGWAWEEYTASAPGTMQGNNNNNDPALQLAEEERRRQEQKRREAIKKRVRPPL